MSAISNIESIIAESKEIVPELWQTQLVDSVMSAAVAYARAQSRPVGECLAAGFDLIVASHYYGNVANKGWLYCGPKTPILAYPYTNTCPRCAIRDMFHFHKANKPPSGNIGSITSTYLCLCYQWYFKHSEYPDFEIRIGKEPVDVLILDRTKKICLLAEIKASPLVIFPLVMNSERLSESSETGVVDVLAHEEVTVAKLTDIELFMMLPGSRGDYRMVNLGGRDNDRNSHWAANAISGICREAGFFHAFHNAWIDAFGKYAGKIKRNGSYWLTNSCGAPTPKPSSWPRRSSGSGYETISDNKTSVGMDRTDDIKKGTYQVLKMGSVSKFPKQADWRITVGLVSNIHAVQHYGEYLESISDVMWTKSQNSDATRVGDLPAESDITNLFDGIISFTSSNIRDPWLKKIFAFENAK
jgi:hypothetical protein